MLLDAHDTAAAQYSPGTPRNVLRAATRRRAAPASLVLFVGAAPPPDMCEVLADDGMRSLWLAGPAQALRAGGLARFDALVIDAELLGSRAAACLGALRDTLACPLVVVADRADEIDEILALELGADAYLVRPLAARRLRAHLAALMRLRGTQLSPANPADAIATGGWHVDRVANRLAADGRSVALTDVQCALLQCLLEARGRIVPRARLAAALPHGSDLSVRCVDVYVHRLRRHLRDEGVDGLSIRTVRGRGYALAAPGDAPD